MLLLVADYRLHDPQDTSEYISVQYFTRGAMNPCLDSMHSFVDAVVSVIQAYHTAAGQELKLIHLAGDEVANGAWTNSTACDALTSNMVNGMYLWISYVLLCTLETYSQMVNQTSARIICLR